MKTNTAHPTVLIGDIRISTDLALHPDFAECPEKFAHSHNVALADCVSPETSFRMDRTTNGTVENRKANVHLVGYRAIRLFVENDENGDRLRSIAMNPAELLHGDSESPVTEEDLQSALALMESQVSRLLADPQDARHIVPGHAGDDKQVAYWSAVESKALLPDMHIECFHGLSHFLTGPATGSAKKRIELRGGDGGCAILIEKARWHDAFDGCGATVEGVSITLTLKGQTLARCFASTGIADRVKDTMRLVRFRATDVFEVFIDTMRRLEGVYVPVPPEWAGMGKAVTHAKTMALLSLLTGIPVEELRAMDEAGRHPSKDTCERLDKDVRAAAACLKPEPVNQVLLRRLQANPILIHHINVEAGNPVPACQTPPSAGVKPLNAGCRAQERGSSKAINAARA